MTQTGPHWFSPEPSEITSSRLSVDLGLRKAVLFFSELVVPGIGNVRFARQLSWAVASLALYQELKTRGRSAPKPSAICRGIEALACKLEYRFGEGKTRRIRGQRAFDRDSEHELWSFDALRRPKNYVRNTFRQDSTRALKTQGGLGFATGSRFDGLELESVGQELADAFLGQRVRVGRGGWSLRDWLLAWLDCENRCDSDAAPRSETLIKALSPESPQEAERALIRARLFGTEAEESETRRHLACVVVRKGPPPSEDEIAERLRRAGREQQARDVEAAFAFGKMLDHARGVVWQLTSLVERERGVPMGQAARDADILEALDSLRTASDDFAEKAEQGPDEATSKSFAKAVTTLDDESLIRFLADRERELFVVADGRIVRGPLFRALDGAERDGRPDFRVGNLRSLARDVGFRGRS